MTDPRRSQAIQAAADALALRLHWLKDPERALELGTIAFNAISPVLAVPPAEPQEGEEKRLDDVYAERNAVALAFAWMAASAGWKVGQVVDPDEPDWPVLMIDTPHGQVSWHFTRDQMPGLAPYPGEWDGHSDDEKYDRLAVLVASPVQSSTDPVREAAEALVAAEDAYHEAGGEGGTIRGVHAAIEALRAALRSVREPGPNVTEERKLQGAIDRAYEAAMEFGDNPQQALVCVVEWLEQVVTPFGEPVPEESNER